MVLSRSSRAMLPYLLICLMIDALCIAFSFFVCPQPTSTFIAFYQVWLGYLFSPSLPHPQGLPSEAPYLPCLQVNITCALSFSPKLFKPKSNHHQNLNGVVHHAIRRSLAARKKGSKELTFSFSEKESCLLSVMGFTPQTLHCIRVLGSLYAPSLYLLQ
ncbi:hypothetical protein NA56DRAFT_171950 [Hyaloscypha hepaticicola]|uniref:Uncharacterized protein n=1 Tax=Hyaloscypha hepaticicola TaxID=2082293 RepID=A0A2J6Q326_9HELO|nr:hypothetical protein NA56DRAFT_171950 [Hyaloscypha hepaticicola]